MTKFAKITLLSISLFFILSIVVFAQEQKTIPNKTIEAVNLDENIQPQDLGVAEPKILPGSPLYFLKNIKRGIQSVFTFSALAEAKLKLKFANERLMELKKLADKNPEAVPKALKNYRVETDKLKATADKIKGTTDDPKVDQFLDKFVDNVIKHEKFLGKLEKESPAEIHEKIGETKEDVARKFSDIALKITSPEMLQEKIIDATESQTGSNFKNFKNLEVLQQVAEKVPATAQPAIQQAIENSLNRLKGDLEKMSPEDREKFKDYVDNIGGNETRHLAVVDQIEKEELPIIVRAEMASAKAKILERVETRLKEYGEKNLEAAKNEFLGHLSEQGGMDELRVIKELENNLSPEVFSQVLDIKRETAQKLAEKIELAETPEQQKEFFENVENKYYDVQQLEIFKEIEELIPPEKKELYEKLKEKAMAKMKEEIEKARKMSTEEKGIIIDQLAGDAPEHIKVVKEMVPKPVTPEIIKATAENVIKKAESTEDPAKAEILKQRMEEKEIKAAVEPFKLNITQKLEAKSETLMGSLTQEQVAKQMGAAKNAIETCGRNLDPLKPELRDSIRNNPPYKTLMEQAFKHLANAEKALTEGNFGEAFGQATSASQQASNACKTIAGIVTQKITDDDRFNKWKEFLKKLAEIAPETFPYGYDEKLVPSITILVNCAIPDLSNAKICKENGGEILLKTDPNRCPYLECSKKVVAQTHEECAIGNVQYHKCANGEQVQWCTCKDWKWSCIDYPEKTCPTVEIRYYTCPDGTKVESGRCYMKDGAIAGCSILMRPEMKCPLQTPPVTPMTECPKVEEIKYYQCSDGTQIPWCMCLLEGGFAGAKNKWQCQYYPVGFTCPKTTISPTPTPTPTNITVCCFKDGMCNFENKEECIAKGAKVVSGSSCSPNPCPAPTPIIPTPNKVTDYIYNDCVKEGMSKYQCPNGNIINWKCSCLVSVPEDPKYRAGGYTTWNCTVEPEKSCPITSEAPLAITLLYLKYYQPTTVEICWTVNKALISRYVEYGTTASYGLTKESGSSYETKISGCAYLPSYSDKSEAIKPNTTYHFRIISTDTNGNTFISDDYTFSTIPECLTGTIRNYQCSDGTIVDWCKCALEEKWSCLSSPESACPIPVTPAPTPVAAECKLGEIKQYKCSDGTLVDYCKCTAEGKWDCIASPEKSCPVTTTNTTTPVVDTTAPVISDITARDITSSGAKIEWKTDEPATSQVVWGTADTYHTGAEIQTQPVGSSLATYHSVPLSDLQPNTLYHFRVESKDAAGNSAISESKFFTTAEKPTGFIKNQLANITGIFSRLLEGFKNLLGR